MPEALSDKQKAILDFIINYQSDKGYPPSVREIGDSVGLQSTATVHAHLERLENKGYIRRDPAKPRALEILYDCDGKYITKTDELFPESLPELVGVPVVGRVTAGNPILAIQETTEFFPIPVDYTHNASTFMLRVTGDSMINAGIFDGDLILVRIQSQANNGDVVVALLDGERATVKTFYRDPDGIRLQPENDAYLPPEFDTCDILGKVIGLYRKM